MESRSKEAEQQLYGMLHDSDGKDTVVIYISAVKAMKKLSESQSVSADQALVSKLAEVFGENNVKVIDMD